MLIECAASANACLYVPLSACVFVVTRALCDISHSQLEIGWLWFATRGKHDITSVLTVCAILQINNRRFLRIEKVLGWDTRKKIICLLLRVTLSRQIMWLVTRQLPSTISVVMPWWAPGHHILLDKHIFNQTHTHTHIKHRYKQQEWTKIAPSYSKQMLRRSYKFRSPGAPQKQSLRYW